MNGDITLFLDGLVNAWFNNIENIIVGVISSLVATILWLAIDSIRKSISSKKKISILLDLLYDSADSFDSAMVSENEEIAEVQAEYIIKYCIEIFNSIEKRSFGPKKKKLFITILYNLYYTITYYKRIYVGYSGKAEQKAKLKRFKQKYYYTVCVKSQDVDNKVSFLMLSVCLLQQLVRDKNVKAALNNNYYIDRFVTNKREVYSKLINICNMKSGFSGQYEICNNTFTKREYERYIDKKLKVICKLKNKKFLENLFK